tara:strand:+ start:225 stop:1310 length:1086 start_codon:yes stop_codon:yes gene_type:complete
MLEQAIIDAEALREVALKNAEAAIIDKYSDQIKEAVETLLEQPEEAGLDAEVDALLGGDDAGLPGEEVETDPVIDDMPLAAHDGEELCGCPDEAEEGGPNAWVELDLDALTQHVDDVIGTEAGLESREQFAADVVNTGERLGEDIQIDSNLLEEIVGELTETLKVDIKPEKSGWAGTPASQLEEAAEELLAREQDTEVKKHNEELRKAVEKLEEEAENLNESNTKLNKILTKNKSKIKQHQQNEQKLVQLIESLKDKVEESNILNARLLYTNKALTSTSLNERQKSTIAEALSNAKSVEEAKTIFETLQNTVGSTSKKQPKSLSEAVNKTSSTILLAASDRKAEKNDDPASERWRALAGIK